MTNSDQLCGQCHGNLRFPGTDHLTYNLVKGTGAIGVPDQQLMADVGCTDCHMHSSDVDGSNSKMFRGHSWAITLTEPDGSLTMSCLACHTEADPAQTQFLISDWQAQYQALDAAASANVARMAAALQGVQNPVLRAALTEAQFNLAYAESDESGGFHNHGYLMALLNDANQKALSIPLLNVASANGNVVISWTGPGILQSADSLKGPWHDVSGASNPWSIPPNAQAPQRFYRLRP
jgi:hypothetical protein